MLGLVCSGATLALPPSPAARTVPSFICEAFEYNVANNKFSCPLPTCALCAARFCAPCVNATDDGA